MKERVKSSAWSSRVPSRVSELTPAEALIAVQPGRKNMEGIETSSGPQSAQERVGATLPVRNTTTTFAACSESPS